MQYVYFVKRKLNISRFILVTTFILVFITLNYSRLSIGYAMGRNDNRKTQK